MAGVTGKLKFSLNCILLKILNIYSYWLKKVANSRWLLYRTAQLYGKGPGVVEFES